MAHQPSISKARALTPQSPSSMAWVAVGKGLPPPTLVDLPVDVCTWRVSHTSEPKVEISRDRTPGRTPGGSIALPVCTPSHPHPPAPSRAPFFHPGPISKAAWARGRAEQVTTNHNQSSTMTHPTSSPPRPQVIVVFGPVVVYFAFQVPGSLHGRDPW